MTCRKAILRYQNQAALLAWDKFTSYLCYCVSGIRHGSSVSSIQAFMWNLGTYLVEELNTKAGRGGMIRSSVEVDESLWSEGIILISDYYGTTNNGRIP